MPAKIEMVEGPSLHPHTKVTTQNELKSMVAKLKKVKEFGVDTESNNQHAYQPEVCLIQISTATENFLVQLRPIRNLQPLKEVFSDPNIRKIFHAAENDLPLLERCWDLRVVGVFDTQIAAGCLGLPQGLGLLLGAVLGIKIPKSRTAQLTDWSQPLRRLPSNVINYAIEDSMHLLELARRLEARLESEGLTEFYEELADWIFSSLVVEEWHRADGPETPNTAKISKSLGRMEHRQRLLLEALLEYREQLAFERDLPPFKIANNEDLVRVAREATADGLVPPVRGRLGGDPVIADLAAASFTWPANQPLRFLGVKHKKPNGKPKRKNKRQGCLSQARTLLAQQTDWRPEVVLPSRVLETLEREFRGPVTEANQEALADRLVELCPVRAHLLGTRFVEETVKLWAS